VSTTVNIKHKARVMTAKKSVEEKKVQIAKRVESNRIASANSREKKKRDILTLEFILGPNSPSNSRDGHQHNQHKSVRERAKF
jgi:hypothetical protein